MGRNEPRPRAPIDFEWVVREMRRTAVPDWLGSHVRGFEYFGCAPKVLVPDQLRSAVTRAARHDPDIQTAYAELAKHYDAVVIPARPHKPRDKATLHPAAGTPLHRSACPLARFVTGTDRSSPP